jgi:hypothetical protein
LRRKRIGRCQFRIEIQNLNRSPVCRRLNRPSNCQPSGIALAISRKRFAVATSARGMAYTKSSRTEAKHGAANVRTLTGPTDCTSRAHAILGAPCFLRREFPPLKKRSGDEVRPVGLGQLNHDGTAIRGMTVAGLIMFCLSYRRAKVKPRGKMTSEGTCGPLSCPACDVGMAS